MFFKSDNHSVSKWRRQYSFLILPITKIEMIFILWDDIHSYTIILLLQCIDMNLYLGTAFGVHVNPRGEHGQNPPIGSAIFHVLGVFQTSCTSIVKSRKRGCFHKSTTKSGCGLQQNYVQGSENKNSESSQFYFSYGTHSFIGLFVLQKALLLSCPPFEMWQTTICLKH